jgi:hypothetical protein
VRSGPTWPPATPWIAWQPTQAWVVKSWRPWAAGLPSGGSAAGAFWRATHAWNSGPGSTTARCRMFAWDTPQNSAHWPGYTPAAAGASRIRVRWPGTVSRFPPRPGTQKLWMTSIEPSSRATRLSSGR